jgi:hypothetical protein
LVFVRLLSQGLALRLDVPENTVVSRTAGAGFQVAIAAVGKHLRLKDAARIARALDPLAGPREDGRW